MDTGKSVSELLGLGKKEMVVLVGGGGKTTLLSVLARELADAGRKVLVTTTTRTFVPSGLEGVPRVFSPGGHSLIEKLLLASRDSDVVLAGSEIDGAGKIRGIVKEEVDRVFREAFDVVLVEGDGARGHCFKAPRSHEPVIPTLATLVIPVVGADCLRKPLSESCFHAPDVIALLTGLEPGEIVDEAAVARVLLHPAGYRKRIPRGSRWVPFINKIDLPDCRDKALALACLLRQQGVERVVVGSARRRVAFSI